MTDKSILKIIEQCIPSMRRSRQKTLSMCVRGALHRPLGKLTSMARGMGDGVGLRHRIKRVGRFLGNDGILVEEAAPQLLSWLLGRQGPLLPVVVLMDWTVEHGQHVLMLSLKWGKRSLPFYWYSVQKGHLSRSQNHIEATVLRLLRSWLHDRKIILIADRGFARSALFKQLKQLRMDYIIRLPKSTHMVHVSCTGALGKVRLMTGKIRDFKQARLGANAKVPMRLVLKKARVKGKLTSWYLGTSLTTERKESIVSYYERRMGIEATFKDLKSTLGWRYQTGISNAKRLSRYLLILVMALICALIAAERKIGHRKKKLVALEKAFHYQKTTSFVQLGIWLIQYLNPQKLTIHPRKLPTYAY